MPPSVPVSRAHVITRPRVTCAALLSGRWRHQAHVDYVESQAVDSLRTELPDRGALSGLMERINGLGLDVIDVSLMAPPAGK